MDIYTDGSCEPNSGKGAWSFVVVENDEIVEIRSGVDSNTTCNRMEYLALIKAIEFSGSEIDRIYSDSMLLVNTCNNWRKSWKKKGWNKKSSKASASKHEIKNLDLVKKIDDLLEKHNQIEVHWVKGHSGNIFNEAADEIAKKAVKKSFEFGEF